ncbi:MAG: zinc-dependent alcohol dehydrogenase [Acidimicrobiales bacterium]
MDAALITGKGELRVDDVPEPTPDRRGVVVDIQLCGICGTDIHAFQSGAPYNPAICGHEWTGTLSAIGDDVPTLPGPSADLAEGDRVVVAVPPACGTCDACRAGQSDRCQVSFLVAVGRDPLAPPHGGFAPRLAVGANRVLKVHPDLSITEAAQVEPATVAFHAVRRTQPRLGAVAVVQGAGPIGLTTLQWVAAAGAGEIIVVEPNDARRTAAATLGATTIVIPSEAPAVIADHTSGLGADVVYECVGRPETIQGAVELARRGGVVSMIGLANQAASIDPATWLVKEITLEASLAFSYEDLNMAMTMIAAGRVDLDAMHSRTVGLADLGSALDDLAGGSSQDLKVLVDPNI